MSIVLRFHNGRASEYDLFSCLQIRKKHSKHQEDKNASNKEGGVLESVVVQIAQSVVVNIVIGQTRSKRYCSNSIAQE